MRRLSVHLLGARAALQLAPGRRGVEEHPPPHTHTDTRRSRAAVLQAERLPFVSWHAVAAGAEKTVLGLECNHSKRLSHIPRRVPQERQAGVRRR